MAIAQREQQTQLFTRGAKNNGNTKHLWVFDKRTNMSNFGKRTPFTRDHFKEFEACFGDDPRGSSPRVDQGEEGRFRVFSGRKKSKS